MAAGRAWCQLLFVMACSLGMSAGLFAKRDEPVPLDAQEDPATTPGKGGGRKKKAEVPPAVKYDPYEKPGEPKKFDPRVDGPQKMDPYKEPCTKQAMLDKELDVVIYGATGFTGKLAAKYLAAGHPDLPKWGIAARNARKLHGLNWELHDKSLPPGKHIAAALNDNWGQDPSPLEQLANRTRTIVSFAGPYEVSGGEHLIEAAMKHCANYVDVSTESAWNAKMLRKYAKIAHHRGLVIVQSAGANSLPADLLVSQALDDLAADGNGPADKVDLVWTKVNGWKSAGQVNSAYLSQVGHGAMTNPNLLAPGAAKGTARRTDLDPLGQPTVQWDTDNDMMLGWYPDSATDLPVIRRTVFKRFPNASINMSEWISIYDVMRNAITFFQSPKMLFKPPPVIFPYGSRAGSPKWMEESGSMEGFVTVRRGGKHKKSVKVSMQLAGDPGSLATSKLAVEVAIGLSRQLENAGPLVKRGYLTPSLAVGNHSHFLANRLKMARGTNQSTPLLLISKTKR